MLKYFKREKDAFLLLLQQTERVLTEEERKEILEQIDQQPRFSLKIPLEMLSRAGSIREAKIKVDKLQLATEIIRRRAQPGFCKNIVELFSVTADIIIRRSLMELLPEIAGDEDAPSIIGLLKSSDRNLRKMALEILRNLTPANVSAVLAPALRGSGWSSKTDALWLLYSLDRVRTLEFCREFLIRGNEKDIKQAILILSKMAGDEAIATLEEAAVDKPAQVRLLITQALRRIGTPATRKGLETLLNDSKKDIVLTALDGLSKLGDRRSVKRISKLIEIEDLTIQLKVLDVLGQIGNEMDVDVLIYCLKDPNLQVRQRATEAILQICSKEQTNIPRMLVGLMADRDVNVRRCVAEILSRVKQEDIFGEMFGFLEDEDWWVREAIADTLSKLKDRRVVIPAIHLLAHDNEILRRYGLEILVGIEDNRAIDPILKLLHDPDWWVRERAIEALGYLGDRKIVPLLINMLKIPELAFVSARSLGNLGDTRAVPHLMELLQRSERDVKIEILSSLAKLDATSAANEIKQMLLDSDRNIRQKAKEVLRTLRVELQDVLDKADRWWVEGNMGLLDVMLLETRRRNATDLLLVSDKVPLIRVEGDLISIGDQTVLSEENLQDLIRPVLSRFQEEEFQQTGDLDFSYEIPGEGRFRGNIMRQRNGTNITLRLIPDHPPPLADLRVPAILKKLAMFKQGMILITGPAACGKTTTAASLIDYMNHNRYDHIITIEDPIEYLFENDCCLVTQRDVGVHTQSFAKAVHASLREDPDIIFIGEMRDYETISMAITAAETGHLVIGTLHTLSAPKTVDRIVDIFPTQQQAQIRMMISESLRAILSQQLLHQKDGTGRIAAFEVMIVNNAISYTIRENKIFQIPSLMVTGQREGMQTMDQSIAELLKEGVITADEALLRAFDKELFQQYVEMEHSSES